MLLFGEEAAELVGHEVGREQQRHVGLALEDREPPLREDVEERVHRHPERLVRAGGAEEQERRDLDGAVRLGRRRAGCTERSAGAIDGACTTTSA